MKESDALRHWLQKPQTNGRRTILFIGTAAAGRTAAEDLAKQAHSPLMAVSVANLLGRSIGETEKNLNAVFRKAEAAKAILFFDEGDALFGKRSAVKNAHDRYANAAIGHLLQCMEACPRPCILSVQRKANLDAAFLRRFQHTVRFPVS